MKGSIIQKIYSSPAEFERIIINVTAMHFTIRMNIF